MKYLAAVGALVAAHFVFLYLFWLSGHKFERGSGLLGVGMISLYIGGCFAAIILATWKEKK